MRRPAWLKKAIILLAILLAFLAIVIPARIYSNRAPVLMVIDASFSQLYGSERIMRMGRSISASLFRRLEPVIVGESAGPEAIVVALEETHEAPWSVIFPFRYLAGARHYKEAMPETPVYVIGATVRPEETLDLVRTDTLLDVYRAGAAAALFTGEKRPIFLSDGNLPEEQRQAFRNGLLSQGYSDEPVFYPATSVVSSYEQIGCVIIAGPAIRFLDLNLDLPVILFSWIDPEMTPPSVKLIFDDSPFALAVQALKAPVVEELRLPSSPTIMKDRIAEKEIFKKLKEIVSALDGENQAVETSDSF